MSVRVRPGAPKALMVKWYHTSMVRMNPKFNPWLGHHKTSQDLIDFSGPFNKYSYMEYNIIYNSLIESRSHRPKHTAKGFELHHITPKSFGGTDHTDNLVSLTPKEHFIAHRLLVKINTGERATKMALALHRMATGAHKSGYWITARTYTYLRTLRSNAYRDWLQTPKGIAFKERQRQRGLAHKANGTGYGRNTKGTNKGKTLPKWTEERRARFQQTWAKKRQS